MYANNCYISHSDDNAIVITGKCIRVNQIPLGDMLHNADSLQSVFDYKPMHCYLTMVPSTVDGQLDELEKLTIFGTRIAADDPDMLIMHKQRRFSIQACPRSNAKYQKDYADSIQGGNCYGPTS